MFVNIVLNYAYCQSHNLDSQMLIC